MFVCSPVNQSPAQSARSSVYPTLEPSGGGNSNPFGDDDEENDTAIKPTSTNNR